MKLTIKRFVLAIASRSGCWRSSNKYPLVFCFGTRTLRKEMEYFRYRQYCSMFLKYPSFWPQHSHSSNSSETNSADITLLCDHTLKVIETGCDLAIQEASVKLATLPTHVSRLIGYLIRCLLMNEHRSMKDTS